MQSMSVALVLLAATTVAAADIYRWTDEAGRVHFGERPPPGAERVELPTRGPSAPPPDEAQRRARQQRAVDAYAYEREQKAAQAARDAERARQLAEQCRGLQQSWKRLNHPGPIYLKSKGGERSYLDEQQRQAEKDRLRPVYRKVCGEDPR